jgi:WhiB family redox-sensing transcriptional regulator
MNLPPDELRNGACVREGNLDDFTDGDSLPGRGGVKASTLAAKAICDTCPVVDLCLEHALKNNIEGSIMGGLTTRERRVINKRRAPRVNNRT